MKTTKRVLSMIVVLGLIASMFTGITVSAVDPIEYDFLDGYRTESSLVEVIKNYDGFDRVLRVNPNFGTTVIASEVFEKAFTNTTVVFSFKYKSEDFGNHDPNEVIIGMAVRDGRTSAGADYNNGTNKPGFIIEDNGDFTYAEDNWTTAATPADFAGYGEYGVWYQIDSVYDLVNQTVTHYVDGKYLAQSTASTNPTSLNFMMLESRQSENDGTAYFADIKIKEVGETVTMTLDQENTTASAIAVKFSEPLSSVADLKLYDVETQTPVAATATPIDGFTYSFSKAGLKAGAEYKVAIPAGVSSLYGSATVASEIYFNAADSSVLVDTLAGTPGGQIFTEDFNGFTSMGMGNGSSTNSQNLGSADTRGDIKWEARIIEDNPWPDSGFNAYARNNALRIDSWFGSKTGSVIAKSKIGQTVTGQDVEIYFDAEVGIPTVNSAYFEFVVYDPAGTRYPVFQINKTALSMCTGLASSSTVDATIFTNPDTLTPYGQNGLANAKSYKVLLGLASGTVKVYVKDGDAYTEIGSTTMNSTLAANGFANIGFRMKKEIGGNHISELTSAYIDNVSVVKCAGGVPANFSDTFDNFSNEGQFGTGASYATNNLGSPDVAGDIKWERIAQTPYGINGGLNAYARSNILRIDAWQCSKAASVGAKSKINSDINAGEVTVTFDAEVQVPTAETAYFEFDAYDKAGNMYPVFQINESVLSMCTGLASSSTVDATIFENPNVLTDNQQTSLANAVSYKVVLNMAAATAKVYAKVGGVYTEVGSTTVNPALIANGFGEIAFRMQKVYAVNSIATYTSAYVDNVNVYLKEAKTAPVVKSVRFDGAPASDAVPFDTAVVTVCFNTDMDSTTLGGIEIDGLAADAYDAEYVSAEKAYVMTLKVNVNLAPQSDYVITVPTTVKDANGVELARAYAGAFRTTKGEFSVTSFTLKNGTEDATVAVAGDTLTAAVEITNQARNEGTYYLIYAVYDDNKLVAVDYVPVNFVANADTATESISFVLPETEGELGVKVMLWESFSTLTPVVDAIVLQ